MEIVKLALTLDGLDINEHDYSQRQTALHKAAEGYFRLEDYTEIVALLLNAGIDPKLKDINRETAYQIARKDQREERQKMLRLLEDYS